MEKSRGGELCDFTLAPDTCPFFLSSSLEESLIFLENLFFQLGEVKVDVYQNPPRTKRRKKSSLKTHDLEKKNNCRRYLAMIRI